MDKGRPRNADSNTLKLWILSLLLISVKIPLTVENSENKAGWDVAQLAEGWPSTYKAQGLIPSTTQTRSNPRIRKIKVEESEVRGHPQLLRGLRAAWDTLGPEKGRK